MVYEFNADEIFEMAIRIEQNGARFYRRAAELQSNPEHRKMLEKLASMEDTHERIFERMRTEISEAEKTPTVFDPEGEASMYLAAMADQLGGEGSPAAADSLTGEESLAEIVNTAIGLEKDSILFYIGMKDLVPPKYGQEKLDEIINEERLHIIQLNGIKKNL